MKQVFTGLSQSSVEAICKTFLQVCGGGGGGGGDGGGGGGGELKAPPRRADVTGVQSDVIVSAAPAVLSELEESRGEKTFI